VRAHNAARVHSWNSHPGPLAVPGAAIGAAGAVAGAAVAGAGHVAGTVLGGPAYGAYAYGNPYGAYAYGAPGFYAPAGTQNQHYETPIGDSSIYTRPIY
jgi:hypothetical protein